VNFLGPEDEYVASGSDDGNFFLWKKDTGELHDIVEGDGSVVNVIEGHPSLPLIAVSGIDHTVKVSTVMCPECITFIDSHSSYLLQCTAPKVLSRS
jgi:WD40 repeat protein